jgi:putative MFS transporter
VLGALPLALSPLYAAALRETPLFLASRASGGRALDSARALLRDLRELASGPLAARFAAVTALWFTLSFWSGGVLVSFFAYLQSERAWTSEAVARLPWGTLPAGIAGYLLAGVAMDRIGRRPTAMLYLAASALATVVAYQSARPATIYAAYCAVTALGGAWTVANTLTAELFPTRLRATATGVAGSLLGRLGFIAGPSAAGALTARLGTPDAMAWLALLNLGCVIAVWRAIPETRGAPLGGAGSGAAAEGLAGR